MRELIVNKKYAGKKLNTFLLDSFDGLSMNSIFKALRQKDIRINDIKVKDNVKLMSADKNPTLKITLPNGMSLIKFRSSKEEYDSFCSELGCVSINIVGRCERNIWNGIVSPQVIIEDYEVVGKTEYYF